MRIQCALFLPCGQAYTYPPTIHVVCVTVILIWWFGKSHKNHQINIYQSIYTTNMGFFPYSAQNHRNKVIQIMLFDIFGLPKIPLSYVI